jgi:hypothetical protein
VTVYVIVILVVVVILFAAYRSLGGAAQAVPDAAVLLAEVRGAVGRSLSALPGSLAGQAGPATRAHRGAGTGPTARVDPPVDGRRAAAAAQQTLDRVPSGAALDEADATARTLLAAAVEDLSWAWRLLQSDGSSPGLTAAVRALRDHAVECCDAADGLLGAAGAAALPEPRDSA